MIEIWNTFCEDISKNKSVKEMVFEKDIVKSFLQELGWSRYKHNLKEQLGLYKGKWRPDFVFYLNNDEENKEIQNDTADARSNGVRNIDDDE